MSPRPVRVPSLRIVTWAAACVWWGAQVVGCEEHLDVLSGGPDAASANGPDAAPWPDAGRAANDGGGSPLDAAPRDAGVPDDAGTALPEPLLLYTFDEGEGDRVRDLGERGLDLVILDPARVKWLEGALRVDAPTVLQTSVPAAALVAACGEGASLTVEAWITPSAASVTGLRSIVSFSGGPDARNFVLGQGGDSEALDAFALALRTTDTGAVGLPLLRTDGGQARAALTHLVAVHRDNTNERLWVDGSERAFGKRTGSFAAWDASHPLAVANEPLAEGEGSAWVGTLHRVAVYCRAIADHHVQELFSLGPER